jgi:hypothetical protein
MTPKNTPASKAPDAPRVGGSALESLTAAISGFETAQSEALAKILAHSQTVGEEVAELASRPTHEELAAVQGRLDESRADHAREAGELRALVAERDVELKALRRARDSDAETIASFRERFRSLEAAAQNIMAGLSVDALAPAPVSVPDPAADQVPAPAAESAPDKDVTPSPVAEPAPAPEEDPFDLGLEALPATAPEAEAAPATEAPAPGGIILPDLDEDPFDIDPARAKLLAAAAGSDDPFDLPEHSQADGATFVFSPAPEDEAAAEPTAPEAPAAEAADGTAGTVAADPFAFMEIDIPAEEAANAPAVQDAPKVIPVYI